MTGDLGLHAALDDPLDLLHVVEIIGRHGVMPRQGPLEHLPGVHQPQILIPVRCHDALLSKYSVAGGAGEPALPFSLNHCGSCLARRLSPPDNSLGRIL